MVHPVPRATSGDLIAACSLIALLAAVIVATVLLQY
jgi:hypothetical protein